MLELSKSELIILQHIIKKLWAWVDDELDEIREDEERTVNIQRIKSAIERVTPPWAPKEGPWCGEDPEEKIAKLEGAEDNG